MSESDGELLGRPFPELPLTQWMGSASSFEELRGKIIAIDFWATWCKPCLAEIPRNNELMRRRADQNVVVVGICATSGAESMEEVVRERGIAYPVVRDEKRAAEKLLRVRWYPCHYVVDRDGVVRAERVAFDAAEACIRELLAKEEAVG